MKRRQLLSLSVVGVAMSTAGCITARRTAPLMFDPQPPDRPDECPFSHNFDVAFPVPLEDESVETLTAAYERELRASDGVDPDTLSIEVTLTSWGQSYIADLRVTVDDVDTGETYSAAYYVDERQLMRSTADGTELPVDPREGHSLECRQRID
ncbi:hypothetical protein [Natronocalculus amylovorans]|uniref:Lipoprotein n=1 Tax=Natronocalculus amylovorans TaxID=2917812 RepID=A0AAE3FXD4_9EURY|nr:hypothetical protein [Natronocalculus amylovorans]MCL9817118.1 hypothetical protein [Natronocalculus amylovorans]